MDVRQSWRVLREQEVLCHESGWRQPQSDWRNMYEADDEDVGAV